MAIPSPALTLCSTIVTFRWASSGLAPGASERAEDLAQEAEALGATLCAFGPFEISFAFGESDVQDAADFAARTVRAKGELARAGMAVGEITTFLRGEGFIQLAFGPPLVIGTALARFAQPGEVLVDAALAREAIRFVGEPRQVTLGGKPRTTYVLDVEIPLADEVSRDLSEVTHVDEEEDPVSGGAPVVEVATVSDAPPPGALHLLELAREALQRSDMGSLDEGLAQLNLSDEHADIVERLAGVLAMTRGSKDEGLRVLRRAAETEERDEKRGRAVLAYALGVAAAGRHDDALLEALSSLAIARSRGDRSGEKACARFLAQLSFATGHREAASAWEHVARAIEVE